MGEAGDEPTTLTAGFTGMQEGLEAEPPPEQGGGVGNFTELLLHSIYPSSVPRKKRKKGEKERK